MNKIALLFLLILVNTNLMAEWSEVATLTTNETSTFVDFTTIRKVGNSVKIWTLTDHKAQQSEDGYTYLSQNHHFEFDCNVEKVKLATVLRFSDNKSQGKVVFYEEFIPNIWMTLPPNSMTSEIRKIACDEHNLKLFTQTEWLEVFKIGNETHYIDPIVLLKNEEFRQIWQLVNLKKVSMKNAPSRRVKVEYDCKKRRFRMMAMYFYSDSMGEGHITHAVIDTSKWIENGTNKIFYIICD